MSNQSKLYMFRVDGVYCWASNWEAASRLVRDASIGSANWQARLANAHILAASCKEEA